MHPSSGMMGGSHRVVKMTYQYFAAMCAEPHACAATLGAAVDAKNKRRMCDMVAAYDKLGLPHENGWLPEDLRHLRGVNWSNPTVLDAFLRLRDACGGPGFLRLARFAIGSHIEEVGFVPNICELLSAYDATIVVRMLSNDGVVAHIGQQAWLTALKRLAKTYGEDKALRLASRKSVAFRMTDARWMLALDDLAVTYGKDEAVQLAGTDGVACRLLLDEWVQALANLFASYDKATALRLATMTLCCSWCPSTLPRVVCRAAST